jgi:tetratricopeptide (TPR) repeat protein
MRGLPTLNQSALPTDTREARRLFEAALRLDERNVHALVGLAGTHITDVMGFTSENAREQIDLAEAAIDKALSLAPKHPYVRYCCGNVHYARGAPESALREFEFALSYDRNLIWAFAPGG